MAKSSTAKFWQFLPYTVLAIFVLPVLVIVSSLFGEWSENWTHVYDYVLFDTVINSLILMVGVSILVLILGTSTAWIVTHYDFFAKDVLEWALILPLSIPPYILAYTFTGLFDTWHGQ